MIENGSFETIMDLRYKVFVDAEIGGSGIFIYSKKNKIAQTKLFSIPNAETFLNPKLQLVPANNFIKDKDYILTNTKGANEIIEKIFKQNNIISLGKITRIYQV